MDHQQRLAVAELTALVAGMQRRPPTVEAGLSELVDTAVRNVPHTDHCSVTTVHRHGPVTVEASTGEWPRAIAALVEKHREGPLLTVAFEHHMIHVDDMTADVPWPSYRRDVLDKTPIRTVLSYELLETKDAISTMNFYADRPHVFDQESKEMALIFSTHAALALQLLRRDDEFRSALASRDVIGQAKGIIMERFDIDAVQAFELLVKFSQEANVKLVDIAMKLVRDRKHLR
jgi:GAF domain-containing protein